MSTGSRREPASASAGAPCVVAAVLAGSTGGDPAVGGCGEEGCGDDCCDALVAAADDADRLVPRFALTVAVLRRCGLTLHPPMWPTCIQRSSHLPE
jgi:hypothetical protein